MLAATLCALVILDTTVEAERPFLRYTIADLGTLGGTESFAYAVNDRGDVVGVSRLSGDTRMHAFLYSSGSLTDLAPLNSGAILTAGPTGINNMGQIASGLIEEGVYVPALYDARTGSTTILGSLGGVTSFGFSGVATAVNQHGHAVGYSYIDSLNRHAFLFRDGVMTDIGSFGGYSAAMAINRHGTIVGFASDAVNGYARAFIYEGDVMREIDPFGSLRNESYAEDVNNKGQVVGFGFDTSSTAFHAFSYSDGASASLGTLPGGRNSYAYAINDHGEIVGIADSPYDDICDDPVEGTVPCVRYEQRAVLYRNGVVLDLNRLLPTNSGWRLVWAFDINAKGEIVGYGIRDGRFKAYLLTPDRRNARGFPDDQAIARRTGTR